MFCCTLLYVHFSIAIILMGKRELIALLNLPSWCLVMVERLFLTVPQGCLQFVIVVFPDHTHLLFLKIVMVFDFYLLFFGVGSKTFVLEVITLSSSEDCVLTVFNSGFATADCTIFEKVTSGVCSTIFLASMYVMFLVTLNFIISFSFFQTSHTLDLERWSRPQLTHLTGFWHALAR